MMQKLQGRRRDDKSAPREFHYLSGLVDMMHLSDGDSEQGIDHDNSDDNSDDKSEVASAIVELRRRSTMAAVDIKISSSSGSDTLEVEVVVPFTPKLSAVVDTDLDSLEQGLFAVTLVKPVTPQKKPPGGKKIDCLETPLKLVDLVKNASSAPVVMPK